MTNYGDNETKGKGKPRDAKHDEIRELEQGEALVREYWQMVADELREEQFTSSGTSDVDTDGQDMRESNPEETPCLTLAVPRSRKRKRPMSSRAGNGS